MVEDYPRILIELEQRFSNEEACAEYPQRSAGPPDGSVRDVGLPTLNPRIE